MNQKLQVIILQFRKAILHNPAEVTLSVVFFILACIHSFHYDFPVDFILPYFPAFFLATYTLNQLIKSRKSRWVYYLSILFFLPFLGNNHSYITSTYFVTLVVFQLIYLISKKKKENLLFIQEILRYLKSVFSAGLLACIIWLVVVSIYYSIRYIFEIWQHDTGTVMSCISYFSFLLSFPLLFLMFDGKKPEGETHNRLFEVLLNYILSPALLIYAGILYLYFLKITVLWSLPKGDVAYIVVSFTAAVFLLKGCQVFLRKRYYDWFYKHASLIVLPALIMYWVGACYRINQYGFTELRVYLVVVGLILTSMAILFLSNRWGRYYIVALLTVILLSVVTYIPGIGAEDIEYYSQTYRSKNETDYQEESSEKYSHYHITDSNPISIENYKSLCRIYPFNEKAAMWMMFDRTSDSLYLFSSTHDTLYQVAGEEFLQKQLQKANIAINDTIPESAFRQILIVDLDTAAIILESLNISRHATNAPYRIDYLNPTYYLKK